MKTKIRSLKERFKKLRLRDKFIIVYLYLLIIPVLAVAAFFYIYSAKATEKQTGQIISQTLNQAGMRIDFILKEVENLSHIISKSVSMQDILRKQSSSDYEDVSDFREINNSIRQITDNPMVEKARLYVDEGKLYARDTDESIFSLRVLEDNKSLKALLSEGKAYGWAKEFDKASFKSSKNINIVSYLVVIKDYTEYNRIVGCLSVDLNSKIFSDILQQIRIAGNEYAFIRDRNGEVIAASSESLPGQLLAANETEDTVINGQRVFIVSRPVASTGWEMVYATEAREISKDINRLAAFTIALVFGLILLSAFAAVFISDSITRGITTLARKMKKVDIAKLQESEEIEWRETDDSRDEVFLLQNSFHKMIWRIRQLLRENYQVQIEKREAQLAVLQAQINPHFLYNVFDAINWMAIRVKAENISEVVNKLGRFYRIGLNSGREIVKIKEELEHVKLYVDIQELRCGESLQVEFDFEEAVLEYKTVKFVLQPIVENAINHGIMKKSHQQGKIRVEGRLEDSSIYLRVMDDGAFIDLERAEYCLKNRDSSEKHGYGLRNVNDRIKLFFGEDYGIRFKLIKDFWSIVEIVLPLSPGNSEGDKTE